MSDRLVIVGNASCKTRDRDTRLNRFTQRTTETPLQRSGRLRIAKAETARRFPWFLLVGRSVWVVACVLLAMMFSAVGCGKSGPKTVRVTGRVLLNGQPLTVTPTEAQLGGVQLRFIELGPDGAPSGPSFSTNAKPDGTFNVLGIGGRGLPPGKYRIAVYQYDPYPEDKLTGRFSDERSPIVRQIDADTDLGEIDLAKTK